MKLYPKNYWQLACMLFSLLLVLSSCKKDDERPSNEIRFDNIALTGEAEVRTPPVETNGSGTLNAIYNLETKVITYNVTWTLGNPSDRTVGMHFHGPATRTENAPVVIGIPLASDNYTGTVSGQTRPLTEAEEEQLLDGLWYFNIHSTTYPSGELRGQVE